MQSNNSRHIYLFINIILDDCDNALPLMEKIKQIHKSDLTISPILRSSLICNYASYYQKYCQNLNFFRAEEYSMALVMIEEALKLDLNSQDDVASAVDYNNKTVILLSMQNFQDAYKWCKKSLLLLEPIVLFLLISRFLNLSKQKENQNS